MAAGTGKGKPQLTVAQVLAWADAHQARVGRWPTKLSGPVLGVPGETWPALDQALRRGWRGLPGGDSLSRLLGRQLGAGRRGWHSPGGRLRFGRSGGARRHARGRGGGLPHPGPGSQ
jgi:hypothetical protein